MNNSDCIRPNPDDLLESIKEEEKKETRGRLRLFFGMCAGVGKTYAMLEAAHKARKEGIDAVIGFIETHKRIETEELTVGLESVPLKQMEYRGSKFNEMDIDAILIRKPQIVLVDELAHTNIPGSRHNKRYQDVLEILEHGIDVFSSVNVQHLESRTEIVKQITGTGIRERIPDSIFDRADEIELIDITPDELLKRLLEGKVYTGEKSRQAVQNFFRKGNLTALREMTLRLTAERVDLQLRDYMSEKKISGTWKSGHRLLVAIGPSPYSAELLRWTRRLAYSMEAKWIAVYVETEQNISEQNKDLLTKNFDLARELGAEIITTYDSDIVKGIIRVAQENNVTQIVVGKSKEKGYFSGLFSDDITEKLLNASNDIDIYIVGGAVRKPTFDLKSIINPHSGIRQYILSATIIMAISFICSGIYENIGYQTVSLLFLLTISILPLFNFGAGPILLAAFLSSLSWDFFFIPPRFTFHIDKIEDFLMFIMYFIVASVAGSLSAKIRTQEKLVRQREKKTNALYNLTKELSEANDIDAITEISIRNIKDTFSCDTVIIYSSGNNLALEAHHSSSFLLNEQEWGYAQWVFNNSQKAGKFSNTLPLAEAAYYPLKGRGKILGVIGIKPMDNEQFSFDQQNLFDTFIIQIAIAVERDDLNESAKRTFIISESEKLYKTLFNSISHELKTPITTIISASSSINEEVILKNQDVTKSLAYEINVAAKRLNTLVENLLDMTRLESGVMKLKLDWHDIKDLIYSAGTKLKEELINHKLVFNFERDIKLFKFDFTLLEQVIVNIIRNSILYSPEGSLIEIYVKTENNECVIILADCGPGFPEESLPKIFNKFYRVPGTKTGGTGLGLSISKGFIDAHKGKIDVTNKNNGGALFTIRIPMEQ
jgi:two-component system, OmpR family, sensor histidine kinase KdpD